ncbi:MAG: valine--tRNA ligase [Candidatus Yanofskybacteria bacterium]|nr:valine--tRNA ligase [Candidatus Yanofskybacteria bacterium]
MELPKAYNPKETEDRIYKLWEESGFFNPDNLPGDRKEKFVTAIAPPNITGELHMGHALELSLQDILVRLARMQGKKTLWIPGIDHAGIAAQNVVEKQLKKEGTSRFDLGREKFEQKVQEWKEKYGNAILDQFKKLGISVDWTRTRYTRDERYEKAVKEAFKQYHEKGWIYKGTRVINWCVRCGTAISDLEVNYVPEQTKLYYIKYGPFTLATTRPETKLGDTALAVNPDDERYKEYVGKEIEIDSVENTIPRDQEPKTNKINIVVVADGAVDKEFGTGIIKVTPAHDITDSEIGARHNLPSVKIINEKGRMNENAGIRYESLKVSEAREQIVKDLETLGLIEKIEDYFHNIGHCDRCDSVIEPLPSEQWFLKVGELSKLAQEAIENGEVTFHSNRWRAIALQWLKNMRDWNISRQLWWGHKIPIDGEEDVLDTWFSSALWPFATLGWPEETQDLKEYYPTHYITSDRGILFLWQLRMIFSAKFFTGHVPFKDVYIHATVLTKDGRRMSKSLGTGINPIELIEKYGTDALRFGLAYQTTDLQDLRFGEDTIMMGKKFANKLWNISRYVLMKVGENYTPQNQISDHDIVRRTKEVGEQATSSIQKYQFGDAAHTLYDFVWHDFADKFIEETKDKEDQTTKDTLFHTLVTSLKLLHPFMPFITEEIYSKLPIADKKLLLIEDWPYNRE